MKKMCLAALCTASLGYGALTDNLVHYYTFDGSSYSAGWLPAAGGYTLGGNQGNPVAGQIGQAMGAGSSFSGTGSMAGEYFQPGTGNWTLSFWARQAPVAANRILIRRGPGTGGTSGGWQISRNANGTLALSFADGTTPGSATSSAVLPDDAWGYLTLRRKGDRFQLLLNGTSVIDAALSSPTVEIAPKDAAHGDTWNREFRSGPYGADYSLREGDAIDELAVWTRALHDKEIDWLYNAGSGKAIPLAIPLRNGLQQYFPLDADFTAADGQGNLASLTGGSVANFQAPGKFASALAGTAGQLKSSGDDNARFHPGTGDFTLSLWYKPYTEDVPADGDVILARGALTVADNPIANGANWNAGWNLRLNADRTVSLRLFEGFNKTADAAKTITGAIPVSATGEWSHLAYTRKGTAVTLYVNGTAESSTVTLSPGASIFVDPGQTWGRELDTRAMRPGEMLDELAFWNRALAPADIQTLASGAASLAESLDPGDSILKRTVSAASENWSSAAWFTTSATGLPWSETASGAEITFTQAAASLVLDRPAAVETLLVKTSGSGAHVTLLGSETLTFAALGSLNSLGVGPGDMARFNLPVSAGLLDVAAHGAPAATTPQWLGRVAFQTVAADEIVMQSGLIDLPDSSAFPGHQIGLVTLRGGSGAAAAGEGAFTSVYPGNLAFSGNAYLHVRDEESNSPAARLTLTGTLSGEGTLLKHNTGTLALTGSTTIAGSLYMVAGTTEFTTGGHQLTDRASVQAATLKVGGDAQLALGRLVGADGLGANSVIEQTGGSITVTGSNNAENNAASCILAHWNALTTYSMSGGSLSSATAKIRAVQDGRLNWTIENASVSAPGIYARLSNGNASAITLNTGAVMTLGNGGIRLPANTAFTLNDGATLAFSASAVNNKTITLGGTAPGAVLNLGGNTVCQPGFAGNGTLGVSAPGTLVLTGAGSGDPLVVLDSGTNVKGPPLTLEQTSDATEQNWKTLTGGAAVIAGDLSLIHNTGDSVSNNTVSTYTGRFRVPAAQAGQTWYFAGNYDDNIMLKVDGAEVFTSAAYNTVGSGSVGNLAEGWHTFEVRAREIGGDDGPNVSDWKSAAMALGFRAGSAPSNPAAASQYTRFSPENLEMEVLSPFTATDIISGGAVKGSALKLSRWRVHLGADDASSRITAFEYPADLDGATVSFTADSTTLSRYFLGRFTNADKATFTGLPAGLARRIEADGRVYVGVFGLKITLY